jgi:hypothetical protein
LPKTNRDIACTFDDFLREEGIYEDVQTTAMKDVLAPRRAAAVVGREIRLELV